MAKKIIAFRIDPSMAAAVEAAAAQKRLTASDIFRNAIETYLTLEERLGAQNTEKPAA